MDWAKGLDFEVKVVGEDIESLDEVEWLFWVGCAGAYEDRAKKTTRAVAELLDKAGVSFGVLGNGETCTGDPARRAGNEFVFQGLAQQNVETFKEYKVKKVVSTCAHCFNTLKNEYKEFGVELEVVHHTQLLNRLVREGKLTPVADGVGAATRSITYHDPCYIGRHNGVYSPPRELLEVLPGAEFKEMPRNSEKSFCCGAGGARMWMEENIGTRINENRTNEAVATGADQIAVGCPFCRVMLSDGLTAQQAKGEAREEVEVLDVAQMLLASVRGESATKATAGGGHRAHRPRRSPRRPRPSPSRATTPRPRTRSPTPRTSARPPRPAAAPRCSTSAATSRRGEEEPEAREAKRPAAPCSTSAATSRKPKATRRLACSTSAATSPRPTEPEPARTKPVEPEPQRPSVRRLAVRHRRRRARSQAGTGRPERRAEPVESRKEPAAAPTAEIPAGRLPLRHRAARTRRHAATTEAEPEPEPEAESEPEPDAGRAGRDPSRAEPAAAPTAEIPEGGSLFDIAAPEPAAPAARPSPNPSPSPSPTSRRRTSRAGARAGAEADSELSPGAALSQAATDARQRDEPEPRAGARSPSPTPAEPVETRRGGGETSREDEKPAEKPKPSTSGEAHQPKTDVDINESGSLFDL